MEMGEGSCKIKRLVEMQELDDELEFEKTE